MAKKQKSDILNSELNNSQSSQIDILNKLSDSLNKSIIKEKDKIESLDKQQKILDTLNTKLLDLSKNVANVSNRYSQISNDLISASGSSARDVRDTRKTIVRDVVSQINKETGMFFNPEKSYEKMVNIAKDANIGSLKVIEEIARPMLIATESLDVNNGQLADIFSKWYTRYKFSSSEMEEMVNEIRGNTAGNNSTAEATLENISKFQNFIGFYADDKEEMKAMVDAISAESSRLESIGINSGKIFDMMYQIGTGDTTNANTILTLLAKSGIDIDWYQAMDMLRSGNEDLILQVSDALIKGYQAIGKDIKDVGPAAIVASNLGQDLEDIMNISNASNGIMTQDEFKESVSGAEKAIDSIDGKFNTWGDKVSNFLSAISESTAGLQENLGVGISDLITVGTNIYMISKLSSALGGSGINLATGGAASLLSNVAKFATSPAGVGIAAGAATILIGKKIYDDYHKLSSNAEYVSDQIESVGENLKKENQSRLGEISNLNYNFDRANDIQEKRRLLEESGLFSQEELNNTSDENLNNLIESYKRATKTMDSLTDEALKTLDKYYQKKTEQQLEGFSSELQGVTDASIQSDIVALLNGSVGEKAQRLINQYMDTNDSDVNGKYMTYMYLADVLKKEGISSDLMQEIAGYADFSGNYNNASKYSNEVATAIGEINQAIANKDKSLVDELVAQVKESDYAEEFESAYGEKLDILYRKLKDEGYAVGSNYITHNQVANIHEGEAIIPKKYNPSANITELEMLRKYYKDDSSKSDSELLQSIKEFSAILSEIKDFLVLWKEDNNKQDTMNRLSNNKYNSTLSKLARYNF